MKTPLPIHYYSDMLCIWAWIAQLRIDELHRQLEGKIELHHHFVDVFGDVQHKIDSGWSDRGGFPGYAAHVHIAADNFPELKIHPAVWHDVRPNSSANAHLVIKACELAYDKGISRQAELTLRKAFFLDAMDISDLDLLFDLLKAQSLDPDRLKQRINNGTAMAELMTDYRSAQNASVSGSPTYVLDGGRQVLFGNVSYRVINANIEELLRNPTNEASWC